MTLLEVEPGESGPLRPRSAIARLVADDAKQASSSNPERAWSRRAQLYNGRLVDRRPQDLVLPVVPREQLLTSAVPAVTEDGIGWDPEQGELWFSGETAEALLLELEARRRRLAAEVDELERRAAREEGAAAASFVPCSPPSAHGAYRRWTRLRGAAQGR